MARLEVFHVWLSMSIKRRYSRVSALIYTIDTHDTVCAHFLAHHYFLFPYRYLSSFCLLVYSCVCVSVFVGFVSVFIYICIRVFFYMCIIYICIMIGVCKNERLWSCLSFVCTWCVCVTRRIHGVEHWYVAEICINYTSIFLLGANATKGTDIDMCIY